MAYFGKREDEAIRKVRDHLKLIKYRKYLEQQNKSHVYDPLCEIVLKDDDIKELKNIHKLKELTESENSQLLTEIIYPAFKKLVDNLIWKYSLTTDGDVVDLRNDFFTHLIESIDTYDYRKAKSFSYFNVVLRNKILQYIDNKKKRSSITAIYRKDVNENSMASDENTIGRETIQTEYVDNSYTHAGEPDPEDAINKFFYYLQKRIAKLIVSTEDKKEKEFLRNVLHIFETTPDIEELENVIGNKRMFYVTMKGLTTLRSRDITKYLTKLKEFYGDVKKDYVNKY